MGGCTLGACSSVQGTSVAAISASPAVMTTSASRGRRLRAWTLLGTGGRRVKRRKLRPQRWQSSKKLGVIGLPGLWSRATSCA
eukprot:7291351-Alexandrium_andersonii.AAC.1